MKKFFFFLTLILVIKSPAQNQQNKLKKNSFVRKGILLDYNSWNENVILESNNTKTTQKALAYGTGISFDWSETKARTGYGFNLGLISSFAVTGQSSTTDGYFVKRNSFLAFRTSLRYFQRINPRFELGLAPYILFNQLKWQSTESYNAKASSNIVFGFFLDNRYRLNRNWELIQALGLTNVKNSSVTWRVGGGYYF